MKNAIAEEILESAQELPKEQEDPRLKYSQQLKYLIDFAIEQGELASCVDACIRELSWIAVARNESTVIVGEILSRLSWYILEQTKHLDAQKELEQTKNDEQAIH